LDVEVALASSEISLFGQRGMSAVIERRLAAYDSQHGELSKALLSVTNPNERIGVAQAMKSVEALRDQLDKGFAP
jgi:hypothetical protein